MANADIDDEYQRPQKVDDTLFPNIIKMEMKGIPVQTKSLKNKLQPARPSVYLKITSAPLIENQFPNKRSRVEAQRKLYSSLQTSKEYRDFLNAFSKVFEEHVEGFTGLSRRNIGSISSTSADGGAGSKKMEWKVRLEEKKKLLMEKSNQQQHNQKQHQQGQQQQQPVHNVFGSVKKIESNNKIIEKKHAKPPIKKQMASEALRSNIMEKYRELKKQKRELSSTATSNQNKSKGFW